MEKWGSVGQRVVRLPPGFRFHPTDEELVQQYLLRKAFGFPLPAAIIPEIELARYDPWDLPGSTDKEKYFFSIRQAKYPNGSRSNRASASGYWKATGKDKQIVAPRSGQVIGMKKMLVFYRGKSFSGCKTDWIMHEYRLAAACAKACIFPQRKNSNPISTEGWVLCRIFRKRRTGDDGTDGEHAGQEEAAVTRRRLIDFMGRADAESRSSSDSESSCVTDVLEGRTEDGSCNSASSSTGGEQGL